MSVQQPLVREHTTPPYTPRHPAHRTSCPTFHYAHRGGVTRTLCKVFRDQDECVAAPQTLKQSDAYVGGGSGNFFAFFV